MKSTLSLTAAAAFFGLGVHAAPADSQECYTVHSGYFAVHPNSQNKGVTLNQNNQVVYGDPGTPLYVDFQACPTLPGNYPDEDINKGRILVGSNCLKIDNPTSATEPYFASVAPCSNNVTPSAAEYWVYGTSDDRGVVYWQLSWYAQGHDEHPSPRDRMRLGVHQLQHRVAARLKRGA
ncbi:hypothetical protein FRC01_002412 [Tulasnella sp. 417]|nr:hypothetical protein FRC01_002412 [Tulasnella sp. 417]